MTDDPGERSAPRAGWREALAIAGLVTVWPVGVALLWWSRVWPTRTKLIGTLAPPGGYLSMVVVSSALGLWTLSLPAVEMRLIGVPLLLLYDVWLVLPVVTGIYLATTAWPRVRRWVLGLAVAGPVAVLIVVLSVIGVVTAGPATGALPDLTTSQFTLKFVGTECDGPVELVGVWITACKADSGTIAAYGPDDHTVDTVVATFVKQRDDFLAPQPAQFFDRVVQGVCRPAAVEHVRAWVNDHQPGGQAEVDGYRLGVVDLGGEVTLSIAATGRTVAAGAPQTTPSPGLTAPGAAVAGQPAIPNLTTAEFGSRLGAAGFSCYGTNDLGAAWVTPCTDTTSTVVAYGPDDHTIGQVIVFPSLLRQRTPEQTGQLFTTVIGAVCAPADAGRIDGWVLGHLGGGQIDVDGYQVTVAAQADASSLIISRSRS